MTHYDEFGVCPTASAEEIQRAHRSLVRLLHPDPIQDEDMRRAAESQLKRINGIYSILMDPARRRRYDLQLSHRRTPSEVTHTRSIPRPSWWRSHPFVAAISLLAGFQAAVWWREPAGVREKVVYLDKTESALPAASGAVSDSPEPLLADTRELRRMLNQVILERDRAVARLNALRSPSPTPPVSHGAPLASSPLAAARLPEPLPISASPPQTEAQRDAPSDVSRSGLVGTWIFSAPGRRTPDSDQYAAEYIELLITEGGGRVRGRYRGRYRVPDRAMSPEVEFRFEGPAAGERRFSWLGNGGSAGELELRVTSENTLAIDWYTSQIGRNLMLGSGTATLVRRRQD